MSRADGIRGWAAMALCALSVVALAGCAAGAATNAVPDDARGTTRVAVELTDRGCTVSTLTVPEGPVTFSVTNSGSGAVTEVEIDRGTRILSELENIAPGLSGKFSVTLPAGSYGIHCPGGSGPEDQSLTVTAAGPTPVPSPTN